MNFGVNTVCVSCTTLITPIIEVITLETLNKSLDNLKIIPYEVKWFYFSHQCLHVLNFDLCSKIFYEMVNLIFK